MDNKKLEVLIGRNEIRSRIEKLGEEISRDYEGKEIIVVSLLRGSFVFTSDLVREITVPVAVDFMTTSSYGHGEKTSGYVKIINDIRFDIKGRDVLVVDDIVDSGNTMQRVVEFLKGRQPKSIKTCVMLDKPSRREVDIDPDYVGFTIEDLFVLGYGLDYEDFYRNLPYIGVFK